jgi:hypothetical protein
LGKLVSLLFVLLTVTVVESTQVRASTPPAVPQLTTTTVAGSGVPGYRDGPSLQAQFMLPAALAMDRAGRIYVADAAAQRIRVIENGVVRTLAGSGVAIDHGQWVQGGYRDGPGAQAQFSSPTGIAVGKDGTIYVADMYNGRIRRVAPDGMVSTFATLGLPSALAFDRAGNLYVADRQLGLRRISPNGTVSVLPTNAANPFGVAVWDQPEGPPIVVTSDPQGLVYSAGGYGGIRIPSVSDAGRSIGTPFQLAMVDDQTIIFTDVRTHTVRSMNHSTSVLLGGDPREDSYEGGGYRDGPATSSLFDVPMGIVTAPDGSFLIADGGNRRVRRIAGFDRRQIVDRYEPPPPQTQQTVELPPPAAQTPAPPAPPAPRVAAPSASARPAPATQPIATSPPSQPTETPIVRSALPLPPARDGSRDFRILYIGNSIIWWDTDWSHSIAGVAERAVNRSLPGGTPHVRFVPVRLQGASAVAMASYLDEVADSGLVDAVVLHLNEATVGEGTTPTWSPPVIAALRRAHLALRSSHVPLLIVASPIPLELGPTEDTWAKLLGDALVPQDLDREDGWKTVLASTEAPSLDLWPTFFGDLNSPAHRPIFSTEDAHLTQYGRDLIGSAIATELVRVHPWVGVRSR